MITEVVILHYSCYYNMLFVFDGYRLVWNINLN